MNDKHDPTQTTSARPATPAASTLAPTPSHQGEHQPVSPLALLRPDGQPQSSDLADELLHRAGDNLAYLAEGKNGSWLRWTNCWTRESLTGRAMHQQTLTMLRDLTQPTSQNTTPLGARRHAKRAKFLDTMKNPAGITSILKCAGHQATRLVSADALDAHPHLLRVADGTLDLTTATLRENRRDEYLVTQTPSTYKPDATPTRWLTFLNEVFAGDQQVVTYIQRVAGYCLTQETSLQQMWVLNGAGSNGKSTFVHIMTQLLGPMAQTTPDSLLCAETRSGAPTNDIARLRGIRLAVLPETERDTALNEKRVKALVAGDTVTARFLYGEYSDFVPVAKYFLTTNHLPRVTGTDHGIWRRLVVIPFTQTFEVDQDPTLKQDLQRELPAILAWAAEGARQYYAAGKSIPLPSSLAQASQSYRKEQDRTGAFIADCLRAVEGGRIAAADLRRLYEEWCEDKGITPLSANQLGAELRARGYERGRYGKSNTHHWFGLSAADAANLAPDAQGSLM